MVDIDRLVAIIIGNGFTKTWSLDKQVIFSSVIAVEQSGIDFAGFKAGNDFVIEYEGKRLAIGEAAWKLGRMRLSLMDRSRVGSDFYVQLFAAALAATIRESGPVSAVITLPIQWYAERESVKDKLKGEYVVVKDKKKYTYTLTARDIRIIPEGFGVLASQMLDDNGCIERREIASSVAGIVEIGTGTTDLSLFNALELVPVKSKGLEIGLRDVWESVQADLNKDLGRELELHRIDRAIREGSFKDSGKVIDMTPYIKKHMPSLAMAISSDIDNRWESGRLADGIYFAGGGAPQLYSYFKYKHGKLVDKAHVADAYGAFLYGMFRARQGK